MLGFWIIAALCVCVTVAVLGRALLGHGPDGGDTDGSDIQVYRDQLRELDRDVARGVIGAAEAERARVETSRRLLEADRRAQAATAPRAAPQAITWAALAGIALLVAGGGLGVYAVAGAPGTPDLPLASRKANADAARAARPGQAALEADLPHWAGPPPDAPADYVEMVEKLRAALTDRPDDLEGQTLLAQHEAALGNFSAAHAAMGRVIALKGAEAGPDDFTQQADLMVLAARGAVSPEAEAAVRAALERAPDDGIALYYLGLMYGQNDRPDLGFPIWRDLLERSSPDTPWYGPIRGQIGQMAALAGVDYTPPAAGPGLAGPFAGPSADEMAAAAEMSPEERAEMVRGMVERLMNRLATEGGTADEWARLIGALAVIGETERARGIWGEAQAVFAESPEGLAAIDAAATDAGLEAPIAFDPGAVGAPQATPQTAPQTMPSGPTAEEMAAAAEMSPEDRAEMIRTMVEQLMDRLAAEGGPPGDWARLISSLAVIGEIERARTIWGEAQLAFAESPEAVAMIDAVAGEAGLSDPVRPELPAPASGATPAPTAAPQAFGPRRDAVPGAAATAFPELADLPADDRAAALDGMVTRLEDEIGSGTGTPETFAQLLKVLGALGETARAERTWAEAQRLYAEDATGLALVRQAAEAIGVAP